MQKLGCSERFTQMARQFHDDMIAFMYSAMRMDAVSNKRPGIRIAYRTDGELLNHRRMHFQSLVSTTTVYELLFADDCALDATSKGHMQRGVDLFDTACDHFGPIINTEETVVIDQPPPNAAYSHPKLM
nr:unnamed protein product [Spirometra erinaceieuropaei]